MLLPLVMLGDLMFAYLGGFVCLALLYALTKCGVFLAFVHLGGFTCLPFFVLMTSIFTLALLVHIVLSCALTSFRGDLLDSTH